jgi:CelD/BcsL family acetyltransferase involved in cellulose biosynthesis
MSFDVREAQGFTELSEEWNRLLFRSATDVPFLTCQFQSIWWDSFGQGKDLNILALRDGEEKLQGIAPLYREGRLLRLIGGTELADYLDLIAARDHEEAVWYRLLEHLCQSDDWEVLDLHCIPQASPTREILPRLAPSFDLSLSEVEEDVCPVVGLPETWKEYLAGLSKKRRHELRRKLRRADEAGGIAWHIVRDGEALTQEIETFFALHRGSDGDKQAFMDSSMETFFRRMTETLASAGWVELATARVNELAVASHLCFPYGDAILVYNSGYAPDRYGSISPGIVLLAYYVRDAIERGLSRFDFLRGDERYKYDLGGEDTFIYQITLERR